MAATAGLDRLDIEEIWDVHTDDTPVTATGYGIAVVWAVIAAAVAYIPVVEFAPEPLIPALLLAAAFLGGLGYLDQRTRLIRNQHTRVAAVTVGTAVLVAHVVSGTNFVGPALLGATAMFVVMILLVILTGFAGGGDIKFAPVVAAPLAVMSPIGPFLWLMGAFVLCLVVMVARKVRGNADPYVPMVPMMAGAFPFAVAGTAALHIVVGMPLPL